MGCDMLMRPAKGISFASYDIDRCMFSVWITVEVLGASSARDRKTKIKNRAIIDYSMNNMERFNPFERTKRYKLHNVTCHQLPNELRLLLFFL